MCIAEKLLLTKLRNSGFREKQETSLPDKLLSHSSGKICHWKDIWFQVLVLLAFVASYFFLASYRLQISPQVRQLSLENENILEHYRVITFHASSV
jgi:hypothetical protein